MKKVARYQCEICLKLYGTEKQALDCENSIEHKETIRAKEKAERQKWIDEGHDVWYENGMKHAPSVDKDKFGGHNYLNMDGTSDCQHKCGCWMGPSRSGGKVNPFGACPNNPRPENEELELNDKGQIDVTDEQLAEWGITTKDK